MKYGQTVSNPPDGPDRPEDGIPTQEVWFWRFARLKPILFDSRRSLTLQSRRYSDH